MMDTDKVTLGRYSAIRAKARILSYYFPKPHEVALKKEHEAFDRAKSEWLKHAKAAIAETEEMTFETFRMAVEASRARMPDECSECGQIYTGDLR